jgi:(R,R)-butanediol dehydrogenase/meso-butanediol dehydrogenase/diacetyl reductase
VKAVRYNGAGDFPVVDIPTPRPGPHEILIRPQYVGLCFTDKHTWDGLSGSARGQVGGHEFSGQVVALGAGVTGPPVGTFVSVDPRLYCGACRFCRAGLSTQCVEGARLLGVNAGLDGGLAEFCVVPEYALYPLPGGVGTAAAACAEPMCCATRAVRHAGVRIGDNALVLGAEDYGLFTTGWLKAAGVNAIIVVDPSPTRRDAALAMGADLVVDAADDYLAVVRERYPAGADISFVNMEDYVAESEFYIENAFLASRVQGTVVVVRAYGQGPYRHIHPHPGWLKEVTLKHFGNFFGNEPLQGGRDRGDWQVTIDAMAAGRMTVPTPGARIVEFADLVSGAESFEEIFASLPDGSTKTLIKVA